MAPPRYHYRKKGSPNWRLRFQYPPELAKKLCVSAVVDWSLRTPDLVEAQRRSREYVRNYQDHLWTWQVEIGRRQGTIAREHMLKPGTWADYGDMRAHARLDGKWIDIKEIATDDIKSTIPNDLTERVRGWIDNDEANSLDAFAAELGPERILVQKGPFDPKAKSKAHSQRIIDAWAKKRSTSRDLTVLVNRIIGTDLLKATGKTLVEASNADAEALALYYLYEKGLAPGTAKSYVKWLSIVTKVSQAHDYGIKDVFQNAMPKIRSNQIEFNEPETVAFDDEETAKIMAYRPNLPPDLDLLLMLCASMGLRPREALTIRGDFILRGYRCIAAGTKVPETARRVPIPSIILNRPDFPKRIERPLFEGAPIIGNIDAVASFAKRYTEDMGKALRAAGIKVTRNKRFYSVRHRAIDKLEGARVDPRLARAIVGHEGGHKDTHDAYGDGGFSMRDISDGMENIWREL